MTVHIKDYRRKIIGLSKGKHLILLQNLLVIYWFPCIPILQHLYALGYSNVFLKYLVHYPFQNYNETR